MATGVAYESLSKTLWAADLDYVADTIKCALLVSTYTPDQYADEFWADVNAAEVTGTAYTAGGVTLSGKTVTDNDDSIVIIDCDDPLWTTATITGIRYAVFYKDTGSAATSPLISYIDFVTDQSVTANNLSIAIPVTGIIASEAY
jgi:hypothetical protein